MPRVPDFAAPSVGLQEPQGPTLRAPQTQPLQFMGAQQIAEMGKGLSSLGATIGNIEAREREDLRLAKIKEGVNRLDTVIGEQMENPETGYLWTMGRDATGPKRQQAFDEIGRQFSAIEQSLPEGVERDEWKRVATQRLIRIKSQADRHEGEQAQKYAIAESKTSMEGSAKKALAAYGQDEFQFFKGVALADADVLADLAGLPEDSAQRKELRLSITSGIHEGGIRGMAEQDPKMAKQALDAFRSEIDPEKAAGLERLIRTASVHQDGDTLFRSVQGKGDLVEQFAKIDASDLPIEVRDNAKQRAQQAESIAYQTEQRGGRKVLDDLQNWTRLNREDPNMVGPVAVPPAQMIEDARKYGVLDEFTVWVQNGGQYETTEAGRQLLLTLPDSTLRGFATEADVMKAFGKELGPEDKVRFLNKWEAAKKNPAPKALQAAEVENIVNAEARAANVLPEDYLERNLTPQQSAAYQKWSIALRERVSVMTLGREPVPQDYRDAAKALREDAFKSGGKMVPVAVASRDQVANGVFTVQIAPGEFADIQANVVQARRAEALSAILSRGIPQELVSESDIAAQAYLLVTKENAQKAVQTEATTAAANADYTAQQVAKRNGHSVLWGVFQNSLAMAPGGDVAKARASGLSKVDDALLRTYGLTRADAESIADQFFRNKATVEADTAMSAAWQKRRAELLLRDPTYSDASSFWKRQREAFDKWMFEGQERARQENAARFPGDPQFRYEAVWGAPSASFMDAPSAQQMIEFQRGGGKNP